MTSKKTNSNIESFDHGYEIMLDLKTGASFVDGF